MVKLPPKILDYFVEMGRKGGKKSGGKAGRAKLAEKTKEERTAAAKRAAKARWAKHKKKAKLTPKELREVYDKAHPHA